MSVSTDVEARIWASIEANQKKEEAYKEECRKKEEEYQKKEEAYKEKRQKEMEAYQKKEEAYKEECRKKEEAYQEKRRIEEEESRKCAGKSRKDWETRFQKISDKIDRLSEDVDYVISGLGTLGDDLGTLVEFIVVPKIRPQMREVGRNYDDIIPNKNIKTPKRRVTEVDVFLYNTVEAMAVEVKTRLREKDVRAHVTRLEALRKHESEAGIENKKLYGAVVGVIIDNRAREHASKNGLYVVDILEEEDKLEIDPPEVARVF